MTRLEAAYYHAAAGKTWLMNEDRSMRHPVFPTVEDLIMSELQGGRTVENRDGTYFRFSMSESASASADRYLMKEDPDIVVGKYRRGDYKFIAFIGDEHGCFLQRDVSHAALLRNLIDGGFVTRSPDGIYHVMPGKATDRSGAVGQPKRVDYRWSGIILPKQKSRGNPDVEATFVSFWSNVMPLVVAYAKEWFNAPFKQELCDVDSGREPIVTDL